jgi:hypothetical protein
LRSNSTRSRGSDCLTCGAVPLAPGRRTMYAWAQDTRPPRI